MATPGLQAEVVVCLHSEVAGNGHAGGNNQSCWARSAALCMLLTLQYSWVLIQQNTRSMRVTQGCVFLQQKPHGRPCPKDLD